MKIASSIVLFFTIYLNFSSVKATKLQCITALPYSITGSDTFNSMPLLDFGVTVKDVGSPSISSHPVAKNILPTKLIPA